MLALPAPDMVVLYSQPPKRGFLGTACWAALRIKTNPEYINYLVIRCVPYGTHGTLDLKKVKQHLILCLLTSLVSCQASNNSAGNVTAAAAEAIRLIIQAASATAAMAAAAIRIHLNISLSWFDVGEQIFQQTT